MTGNAGLLQNGRKYGWALWGHVEKRRETGLKVQSALTQKKGWYLSLSSRVCLCLTWGPELPIPVNDLKWGVNYLIRMCVCQCVFGGVYGGMMRGPRGECNSFQHHGQSLKRRHFNSQRCSVMRIGWQFKAKIMIYCNDLIHCWRIHVPIPISDSAVRGGSCSLPPFLQSKTLFIINASLLFLERISS